MAAGSGKFLLQICLAGVLTASAPALANTIVRSMPAAANAGIAFSVTNSVFPDSGVIVYAVEDTVPSGWDVSEISNDGSFDATNNAVKWGPYFDNLPRALTYKITPSANATGVAVFSGNATFDVTKQVPISGAQSIAVGESATNAILCSMPGGFVPGSTFNVTNAVTLAVGGVAVYAVQDRIPNGWTASEISDDGIYDPGTRTVKWGPFFDGAARQLVYSVSSPSNAAGVAIFEGSGDFSGLQVPITGRRQVMPAAGSAGSVVCSFVPEFIPGQWFTVTNLAVPGSNNTAFAVEDTPPSGWLVTNISDGGSFDAASGSVRWGPFYTATPRLLTYGVLPPVGTTGTASFVGEASFDTFSIRITGQREASAAALFNGSAVCSLDPNYRPGVAFVVTNVVVPDSNITAFAVQDTPPAGWLVSDVTDGGVFDSATHSVKWGPFLDRISRNLTYTVTPPVSASGKAVFVGQASFDSIIVAIGGQRQTTPMVTFLGSVARSLPPSFTPAIGFYLSDTATPPANTTAYAVEDSVPAGWTVTNISDGGIFDPVNFQVKWGPFFDDLPRTLGCLVSSPANFAGVATFSGTGAFGTNTVAITGTRQVVAGTAMVPILVSHAMRGAGGAFQFDFTNTSGQPVIVLSATNPAVPLENWTVLGAPAPLGGNVYRYTDLAATNYSKRFYRLGLP